MQSEDPGGKSVHGRKVEVTLISVPKGGGTIDMRFLGPLRSILTHWRGTSLACPGEDVCDPKTHRLRTVWKAYAAAEVFVPGPAPYWLPGVIEVTERLVRLMTGSDMRGEAWRLWRVKCGGDRWEVTGKQFKTYPVESLRSDIRMEQVVERIYRTRRIAWDVQQLFEPAQTLTVQDETPKIEVSNPPVAGIDDGAKHPLAGRLAEIFMSGSQLPKPAPNGNGKEGR